jgi:hypothetical protein
LQCSRVCVGSQNNGSHSPPFVNARVAPSVLDATIESFPALMGRANLCHASGAGFVGLRDF